MSGQHRDQVTDAVKALVVRSRHRFAWLGESSPALPRGVSSLLPEASARSLLLRAMRTRLYDSFYTSGGVAPIDASHGEEGNLPDTVLVSALTAANSGTGSWERGWTLEHAFGEDLLVSRNGVTVLARRAQCRMYDGEAELSVVLPSELPALSPGFFTVVGDVNLDPRSDDLVGRLYFNVSSEGAAGLVGAMTSILNGARVPFRLKIADNSAGFRRCDAAVLYLHAADLRRRRLLRQGVDACARNLRSRTPVFTKPLAPGVGLAEERGDAPESFGMRRCRILAEGILAGHEQRIRKLDERVRVVEQHFADAGVDLEAPYLETGSADGYSL
jgi:hypothetical protein